MYRNFTETHSTTRTMEIHQGPTGWYFTVLQGELLIHTSDEDPDRVTITIAGMSFLDYLNRLDYEARKPNG